jgi:hypothetical protein
MALGNEASTCYEPTMTPKSSATVYQDDIDRLKKAAFWYWEYMRRNDLYRRYCDVMEQYHDYFKSIGVFDSMQTKEYLNEMVEYVATHDDHLDIKYPPFRRRLDRDHGDEAGHKYFKYSFLCRSYEKMFGRIYVNYFFGIDTEETLQKIFKGENVTFEASAPPEISALTKLNGSWLVSIDDYTPNNFLYDYEHAKSITIDPKGIINKPTEVSQDIHALNIINKAVASIFEEQDIPPESLQSVYKRNLAGKYVSGSDFMRLSMLWMWDKAHEDDRNNPLPFDDVYSRLKQKIEQAGITIKGSDQIFTHRKRIVEYYATTDFCIKNRTLTTLNK